MVLASVLLYETSLGRKPEQPMSLRRLLKRKTLTRRLYDVCIIIDEGNRQF